MPYTVKRTATVPALKADWEDPAWQHAELGEIGVVRPEGSDHVPKVNFKLLHDGDHIYGIFRVEDRYVRVLATEFQASVCRDSCVEFFFKPQRGAGYFNLEINAGGAFLIYYVRDHRRSGSGLADYAKLSPEEGKLIKVKTTMPQIVDPEISEPITWCAQFTIPRSLIEKYTGDLQSLNDCTWEANLYKCGDDTSHPHWISWKPVTALNFHLPECFGKLILA
ncbi:MAG: diguanylate cyclase [Oligosphaeraceae bacterium]|nr:diguanylate cyclase [Oligosphaeraceae bacterium]